MASRMKDFLIATLAHKASDQIGVLGTREDAYKHFDPLVDAVILDQLQSKFDEADKKMNFDFLSTRRYNIRNNVFYSWNV